MREDKDLLDAAKLLVPDLKSSLFLSMPFGPLGRVQIVLPEQPDDDTFETEFQETMEYVERIITRRRAWRNGKILEALDRIAPNRHAQAGATRTGGDSSEAPANEVS